MTIEDQNSPTNRDEATEAGPPDRPPAMPCMSPPSEASYALPPGASGKSVAAATRRTLSVMLFWMLIVALIAGLLLPTLAHLREKSRRSDCATNLKKMGTGFFTFVAPSGDRWPALAESIYETHHGIQPPSGIDYISAIGSYRGKANDPTAGDVLKMKPIPGRLSTTRGLWMLIRLRINTQEAFVCPSTNDKPNTGSSPEAYWDFGIGDITGSATPEQVRQGWSQVSYGYQVPFGEHARPSCDLDLRMPLAADKGPYGAALDAGLANPPPITVHGNSPPDQWRPWNSPNHGGQGTGEGQNVLFADGHVDWAKTPIVGVGYDNIYTQQSAGKLGEVQGNRPTAGGKQTPASDTDTLIYP